MDHFSNNTWGYKASDTVITVYHHLLPKIKLKEICMSVTHAQEVFQRADGSVTIVVDSKDHSYTALDQISSLFKRIETNFIDTPQNFYKIPYDTKYKLREWSLAFEGCIGILLGFEKDLSLPSWEYINSFLGGLSFGPYTLFLYKNYPKIIHPITIQNYDLRLKIEKKTANFVKIIVRRMIEAQSGLEGLAMLSLVEEKTSLSQKEIVKIINYKSYQIMVPTRSEFFNSV